jgi:hypothetical protein
MLIIIIIIIIKIIIIIIIIIKLYVSVLASCEVYRGFQIRGP